MGSAPIGKIPSYPAFVSKMGSEVERDQEAAAAQERGEAGGEREFPLASITTSEKIPMMELFSTPYST